MRVADGVSRDRTSFRERMRAVCAGVLRPVQPDKQGCSQVNTHAEVRDTMHVAVIQNGKESEG